MKILPNLKKLYVKASMAKAINERLEDPSVITQYNDIVDRALHSELSEEEFDKVCNGYRRSPWSQDALQNDISRLDSDYKEVLKDQHYWDAITYVRDTYFTPDSKLQPVHFTDLRKYPWELSTSVGAPFATSQHWKVYVEQKFRQSRQDPDFKDFSFAEYRDLFAEAHEGQSLEPTMLNANMSKRNLYNEVFYINRKHIHLIKDGHYHNEIGHDLLYWNTAFARQHLVSAEDPDKVRLVFGAPWLLLMAEAMFIWPIQAWLLSRKEKSPMLWGYETLIGGWYRLLNFFTRFAVRALLVITLDWSGFDRYARHTVIKDIHKHILRPMFTFEHGYHPTHGKYSKTSADPKRLENLWKWMTDAILSTPLMMPDGTTYEFQHSGIYSGYLQTQLLDSIYNLVMIYTILFRLGFKARQITLKVQGDDSIISILAPFQLVSSWFLNMFTHYADLYFGAIVSESKTEVRETLENAEVLKYRHRNGIPYREPLSLLAQLRHPERSHSLTALKARSVGIAYANCGSDPRVFRICERIFEELDNLGVQPNASGLPENIKFMNRFLRYDSHIKIDKFPSCYDTVSHLMAQPTPTPSERYWPQKHFIGIPGYQSD